MKLLVAKRKFDYLLTVGFLLLCVIGGIFVYSASNFVALKDYGDRFYFLKKQLFGYILGAVSFAVTSIINYGYLKKYALPFAIISLILLLLVLSPLGKEAYGAKGG